MRIQSPAPRRRPRPSRGSAVQLVTVVLVFGDKTVHGHAAGSAVPPSPCSTFGDAYEPVEAWQRVFKPGHEIMAQGLPEPDI
jgi:hypothetical protein